MTHNSIGKDCRHCHKYKLYEDFHNNGEMRDGKSSYCKSCATLRSKEWREENREKHKDTELRSKYGISLLDHVTMFTKQGGKCAICGVCEQDAPRNTLFVDHCHKTGSVRGLLCHHCNSGLGHFKDDPDLLLTAENYLKERK